MLAECCTYAALETLRRLIPRLNQTGSLLLLNFKWWQRTSEIKSTNLAEGTSAHSVRVERHDDSAITCEPHLRPQACISNERIFRGHSREAAGPQYNVLVVISSPNGAPWVFGFYAFKSLNA